MTTLLRVLDLVAQMESHTSLRIAPDHFLGHTYIEGEGFGYHCSVATKDKIFTGYAAELDDALDMLEKKLIKYRDGKRK